MRLVWWLALPSLLLAQDAPRPRLTGGAPGGLHALDAPRPRITGVAHVAFYVSDLDKARNFYGNFLGFSDLRINDRQTIQLIPEKQPGSDRFVHVALETDDLSAMRRYLQSKGVSIQDNAVTDPDGHRILFVQRAPGKPASPDRRVARSMTHAGIIVNALEPAMTFYRDVLGFTEIWRGSSNGQVLSWVNMKVPDGTEYLEFMLHDPVPPQDKRGSAHHICLEVPDMDAALATLKERAAGYTRPMEIRTGRNRKRQLNLFDPDGTRTELMEPNTVDGQPAPPSTAPPPK